METLIISLLVWLGTHSDFVLPKNIAELPKIEYKTEKELRTIVYGEVKFSNTRLEGAFDKETNTIYLTQRFNLKNLRDQLVLAHELVHFLQAYNKKIPPCRGFAEKEALELSYRWYISAGGKKDPEYEMLIVVSEMSCYPT